MFGPIGFPELLLIFGVALLIFGPRKLPEIGRTIGKALGEFRRATHELKSTLEDEVRLEDHRTVIMPDSNVKRETPPRSERIPSESDAT